jgi:transposase-like protein
MTTPAPPRYAGYRFPAEIISFAVWLYFRFPLSLRHVDEILAARGIAVSHETIRQWGLKFGQAFANQIRRRLPRAGDKWHLDEVAVKIAGVKHWLWRAVDQDGFVLDVLVQSRRNKAAAKRLLRKLLMWTAFSRQLVFCCHGKLKRSAECQNDLGHLSRSPIAISPFSSSDGTRHCQIEQMPTWRSTGRHGISYDNRRPRILPRFQSRALEIGDQQKVVPTGVNMTVRHAEGMAAAGKTIQRGRRIRSVAPLCPACGAALAAGHHGCALACQAPISKACSRHSSLHGIA